MIYVSQLNDGMWHISACTRAPDWVRSAANRQPGFTTKPAADAKADRIRAAIKQKIHTACAIYVTLTCGESSIHEPCQPHGEVLQRRMLKRLTLNGGDAHRAAIREFGYNLQRAIQHPWTGRMQPDFTIGQ